MKRQYQFQDLANEHGFNPRYIEKACRISDILEDISYVPFLKKRLSLYGGTALAFIHFQKLERLSVDIDFNYRHIDVEEDWGDVRNRIDETLKQILYSQGYTDDNIKISPTYPLCRFTLEYTNHIGRPTDINIETGYMRRTPILREDIEYNFHHIGTEKSFKIMTPQKEELFSNKWCTMLYRKTSRDLFDVYKISQRGFDNNTFRTTAVIDSLMRGHPILTEINVEDTISQIPIDTHLRDVLNMKINYDFEQIKQQVTEFSTLTASNINDEEKDLIETFINKYRFEPRKLINSEILHEDLRAHPGILRAIHQRRSDSPSSSYSDAFTRGTL
jgi:predicted nucleotidyltransferase component of viral defense system